MKIMGLKKLSFKVLAAGIAAMVMIAVSPFVFGNGSAKAAVSTNAKNLAGLIAVDDITGNGSSFTSGTEDLGDLIVLEGLFGTGTQAQKTQDLIALIAVDNTVGNGTGTTGGSFSNNENLGDLIVLSGLFGTGSTNNAKDLAALIAVDNVTGNGGKVGNENLGDLIVLNSLFLDP